MALAGIGFEFAAAIAGFLLVGYWIDRHFGSFPKGLIIGLVLGMVGGGYNLIRKSLAAAKSAERRAKEDREQRDHEGPRKT